MNRRNTVLNAEKEFMVDFFGLEPGEIEDIAYVNQPGKRCALRIILTNDHDPCRTAAARSPG